MSDLHKIYLDSTRKRELAKISRQVLQETNQQIPVNPEAIADYYKILFWHDTYNDRFKAQIMYDGSDFAIAINSPEGTDLLYGMNRYSSAHELGHYCIPEQRATLIEYRRKMEPNTWSFCEFTEYQEKEAEYFAACLLMPANEMRSNMKTLNFDAVSMVTLAQKFNVSMEAMAMRYAELSPKRTAVICTKHNKVAWKNIGYHLAGYKIHTLEGGQIHPETLAGKTIPSTLHDSFEEREIHHTIWLEHKENIEDKMSPFKEILFCNIYRSLTVIQEVAS